MQQHTYTGIVQKGEKRGSALGFPTINIPLENPALSGIYAARVKVDKEEFDAVCYADERRRLLEAHLLDFSADLYGWNVVVTLLKRLREGKRFADDEALKKAIAKDLSAARAYFARVR